MRKNVDALSSLVDIIEIETSIGSIENISARRDHETGERRRGDVGYDQRSTDPNHDGQERKYDQVLLQRVMPLNHGYDGCLAAKRDEIRDRLRPRCPHAFGDSLDLRASKNSGENGEQ